MTASSSGVAWSHTFQAMQAIKPYTITVMVFMSRELERLRLVIGSTRLFNPCDR